MNKVMWEGYGMKVGSDLEPCELDVLVAETLEWTFSERYETWSHNATFKGDLPKFSSTGDGMLTLIEEARSQGIRLDHESLEDGYVVTAHKFRTKNTSTVLADSESVVQNLPKEYALIFLRAKKVI